MAEILTPQQQAAVTNRGGALLVSAAAGSGKTKVLVDRLLSYLADPDNPADIDDFLIITYTKAAAAELRGKIAAKLSELVANEPENRHFQQQMQRLYLTKISTVHSFCSDILREYAYCLDIPGDFRVADETECLDLQIQVIEEILNDAYAAVDSDSSFRALIDSQGFGRDDRQIPELILKVYNSARCHLKPEEWLERCAESVCMDGVTDIAQTIWGKQLVDELQAYLDMQAEALRNCILRAAGVDGMEKPTALLEATVSQLEHLKSCTAWDEICSGLKIDFGKLVFPKKCSDDILASQIKAVRNACKKGIERRARRFSGSSSQIIDDMMSVSGAVVGLVKLVKAFSVSYDRLKRSRRILDFGDLEHKTLDLLLGKRRSGTTAAAREIGRRFREVMVDEYQDSNAVQDAIFTALTEERKNSFMVGDVKQSIYQFRLADPSIFLRKYNTFVPEKSASNGESRKVLLSTNFRSGGGVISAVNDVFQTCMSPNVGGLAYGEDEALYEGVSHTGIGEQEVELHVIPVEHDTYAEEAAFVAKRICELLDGTHMVRSGTELRPIVPDDIVILLRSPGSVGSDFCLALEKRGISCTMGASEDLLQTEEVSTLLSLLQVINNPLQDIPLLAVLTSRLFGFTADELAQFRKENRNADIYSALKLSSQPKAVHFVELLSRMRQQARMCRLTELLANIFSETQIDSIFASLPDGETRTENLQSFCQIAGNYEASGVADISRFLEQLEAAAERGMTVQSDEFRAGAVTIMSIHKSKGLEFPVVFLSGLAREFNRESARAAVLCDKELGLGLSCADNKTRIRYPSVAKTAIAAKITQESISEEMRVLYVAMTRARDRLIMTYASSNPESELTELAMRMDLSNMELLTSEVDCPGKWVLITALRRTEAGELFALGGRPEQTKTVDPPWLIRVAKPAMEETYANTVQEYADNTLDPVIVEQLKEGLSFRYGHTPATQTPSKLTATQLKGRSKDKEAAENADEPLSEGRRWRKPEFLNKKTDGRLYGNALHSVMQYIRYASCGSVEDIKQEVARLVAQGYISEEYGKLVDCGKIAAFFASQLGQKIRMADNVLREFKFSILTDADRYFGGLQGERVLLQGVVDCAIVEADGITIIDFKSDYVTQESLASVVEKYRGQVTAYADALSRIYKLPIKSKVIYFFAISAAVSVE